MSHFDEFWNRAASAAQTAASATKRAANSAKLSIAIAAEEEKVIRTKLPPPHHPDRPMMSRSAGSMPPFSALGSFAASGT